MTSEPAADLRQAEHAWGETSSPPSPPKGKRREISQWRIEQDLAKQRQGQGATSSSSFPPQWTNTGMGDQGIGGGDNGSKGKNRAKPPPQQRLSASQKRELVELWATFQTLGHIRKHFLDRHNLRLADSTLLSYDASRRGCSLGKKLRAYFDEVRREYVTNASAVAIAHQAHRLRRYEEIADSALKSKDFSSALKAMELAAKEMGGVLEGKTTVEHRGAVAHVHGSVEDMRQELAMRLRQVVEGGTLLPAPEEEDVATEGDTEGAAP